MRAAHNCLTPRSQALYSLIPHLIGVGEGHGFVCFCFRIGGLALCLRGNSKLWEGIESRESLMGFSLSKDDIQRFILLLIIGWENS